MRRALVVSLAPRWGRVEVAGRGGGQNMRLKLWFHSLGVREARRPRAQRSFLRSARRACTAFSVATHRCSQGDSRAPPSIPSNSLLTPHPHPLQDNQDAAMTPL